MDAEIILLEIVGPILWFFWYKNGYDIVYSIHTELLC